jgi:glycosyltransferase involved in cell wall biosynthesis
VTIPSKTQAYLAAGKPVVMASLGDAADLVRQSGGGVVCPPSDPQAMAGAVTDLASLPAQERQQMASRGLAFFEAHLTMEKGVDALESVFQGLRRG